MGNKSAKSNLIKLRKTIVIGTATVLVILMGTIVYLSRFHIDFSQEYRTIDGYEKIVFKDSWSGQCYRLCTWGLAITENISGFEDFYWLIGNKLLYKLEVVNIAILQYNAQVQELYQNVLNHVVCS